jgi:methyl-accepting chemotaxis protein
MNHLVIQHTKDIAALLESVKSAHKRIDATEELSNGIHKLAANVENNTKEVKRIADRVDNGLREQGRRIGETETALVKISNMEQDIIDTKARVDRIEKEPADLWKHYVKQIGGLLVAAVIGYFLSQFT